MRNRPGLLGNGFQATGCGLPFLMLFKVLDEFSKGECLAAIHCQIDLRAKEIKQRVNRQAGTYLYKYGPLSLTSTLKVEDQTLTSSGELTRTATPCMFAWLRRRSSAIEAGYHFT